MGLLYDHLSDCAKSKRGRIPPRWCSIPVYDITNILWLVAELGSQPGKYDLIPKRPPHETMWVEWTHNHKVIRRELSDELMVNSTVGCWIDRAKSEDIHDSTVQAILQEMPSVTDFYRVLIFERWNQRSKPGPTPTGVPFTLGVAAVIAMSADAIQCLPCATGVDPASESDGWCGTDIKFGFDNVRKAKNAASYLFPALGAFALLHCRNINTETIKPNDPHAERRRNRGLPPKTEYKVLRLDLPNTIRPHAASAAEQEEERKMRFHLCRGHFKNLQHERFKAKGWHWWPAHWRGSKDLGEIHKSYKLESAGV